MPKSKVKKKKTLEQLQHGAMWDLVKRNMTEDQFRDWIFTLTNGESESSAALTFEMKNHVITQLGGTAFTRPSKSRRTMQHERQKNGVETLVTPTMMDLMRSRWRMVEGRTDEGLEQLSLNIIKVKKPRTTKECSKVIEAIKSMNSREISKQKAKQEAA
ncbi:MAG: hypothetical protein K1X72_04405 [Pyrinomonadaceae bacterium]|nr:hypothetical protein [Pyrinomonadaceae bacterium]